MMTNIPIQLRKEDFRFVLIRKGEKAPFERAWQKTSNYRYDDPKLLRHLVQGGNYGVLCGAGNLTVIDADREEIASAVEKELPETFTVLTGGGGKHFYYICKDLEKPIRISEKTGGDLGDVQYTGKQAVGPGSIHPNGKPYSVLSKFEIVEVSAELIRWALRNFIKLAPEPILEVERKTTDELGISITDVVPLGGLQKRGDEYQGPHPLHGSEGGNNFCVNASKGVWHCFRHGTGGGALQWIAIDEGLMDCSDAQPGSLRGDLYHKVLKIAQEKYGMKYESSTPPNTDKPPIDLFLSEETQIRADGRKVTKRVLNHQLIAKYIVELTPIKTLRDTEEIYFYDTKEGIYSNGGRNYIKEVVETLLGDSKKVGTHLVNETIASVQRKTYIDRTDLNLDDNSIILDNGILNLRTLELIPHTSDVVAISKISVTFNPEAKCPEFDNFLSEIMLPENKEALWEYIGSCLLKNYSYKKALLFIGGGDNGKSLLLSIIQHFLDNRNKPGSNTCAISLHNLGDRFATVRLFGKLANVYPDLDSRALSSVGTFLMATGEDYLDGEVKHGGIIRFVNHAKFMYSCNVLPRAPFEADNQAFWGRWIFMRFPNSFPEGSPERIPKEVLLSKLTTPEELSGILNKALGGLKRLREQTHFSDFKSAEETRAAMLKASDPLKYFAETYCELDMPETWVSKEDFYIAFSKWCRKEKLPISSKDSVGKALPRHIAVLTGRPDGDKGRVYAWMGLRLKDEIKSPNKEVKDNQKHLGGAVYHSDMK